MTTERSASVPDRAHDFLAHDASAGPLQDAAAGTSGLCSHRSSFWVAAWAMLGVTATFAEPIVRLGARSCTTLAGGMRPGDWFAFAGITALLAYIEGYRALHRRFTPCVLQRVQEVSSGDCIAWKILAPLYAFSLVGGNRRVLARGWALVASIVAAAWIVRHLPSPWRGLIDGAVAVALAFGLLSLLAGFGGALSRTAGEQRLWAR